MLRKYKNVYYRLRKYAYSSVNEGYCSKSWESASEAEKAWVSKCAKGWESTLKLVKI